MEEAYLLGILRKSLLEGAPARDGEKVLPSMSGGELDWGKFYQMAAKHGVLPLLYDALEADERVPRGIRDLASQAAERAVQQSYRILFLCRYLIAGLEREGIQAVVLKGVGTASFYPVPELRKSGDVDLLLTDRRQLKRAEAVLKESGLTLSREQHGLHHVVYETEDSIEIEVHTMLAEPFDDNWINKYLDDKPMDCRESIVRADCMGVELPILGDGYHAYELLLHMVQHFLYAGFGLKLLCDWVVFWNREIPEAERKRYLRLVEESGVRGFSDIVTDTCVRYLGLPQEAVRFMGISVDGGVVEDFLREILEAEEFGNSASDRMVALRSGSLAEYVREFQHQMHLNFPRAGRVFLLWPALWIVTLARFLHNNRTLRKVSTRAILKNARQRGRLRAEMRLWERGPRS